MDGAGLDLVERRRPGARQDTADHRRGSPRGCKARVLNLNGQVQPGLGEGTRKTGSPGIFVPSLNSGPRIPRGPVGRHRAGSRAGFPDHSRQDHRPRFAGRRSTHPARRRFPRAGGEGPGGVRRRRPERPAHGPAPPTHPSLHCDHRLMTSSWTPDGYWRRPAAARRSAQAPDRTSGALAPAHRDSGRGQFRSPHFRARAKAPRPLSTATVSTSDFSRCFSNIRPIQPMPLYSPVLTRGADPASGHPQCWSMQVGCHRPSLPRT